MSVITVGNLFLSLGAAVLAYGLYKLGETLVAPYFSPLRDLPGPPRPSWAFGNLKQIFDAENSVLHEAWVQEYGTTLKYKGWLNVSVRSRAPRFTDRTEHGHSRTDCTRWIQER